MFKRKRFIFVALLGILLGAVGAGYVYLTSTRSGGEFLVTTVVDRVLDGETFSSTNSGGSLKEGLLFENLVFKDVEGWPKDTELRVQSLWVRLDSLDINDLECRIVNARMQLPFSEPIVLSANYENRLLDANVFTSGVSLAPALIMFGQSTPDVKGLVEGIDVYLQGPLNQLAVSGHFTVKDVDVKKISVRNMYAELSGDVRFRPVSGQVDSTILVVIQGGKVFSRGLSLDVDESRVKLENNAKQTLLDIKAHTFVKKVRVNVIVGGTRKDPDIRLTSMPSYPPEAIMSMLITGKVPAQQTGLGLKQGLAPEMARDALDYYFFAGRGSILAQKLGLSDVSILLDKGQKGVGVKKSVSDQLDLGYEVKQVNQTDGSTTLDQKIGGEYKVTDSVVISVDKEISTPQLQNPEESTRPVSKSEETILLKYKKDF